MTTLPAGYKQTEIGVMPDDWDKRSFSSFYSETSRNGIYKTAEFQGKGTRIVNMGEMFGYEFISNQDMSRVMLSNKELLSNSLKDGDLLFGRRSVVPSGAGKCSLVIAPQEPLIFESSIIRVRLNQEKAYPLFLYYFFASSVGRLLMSSIIAGTNIKGIRSSELKELEIPLPTKTEQQLIATALSDTDALIESLEKLIVKKRQIKQGAMQELLSPKEGWEVKYLEDIATFKNGKAHENSISDSGKYIVVNSKFISTNGEVKKYSNDNFLPASEGDVLMVMSDVPNGKAIAKCFVVDRDNAYTVNQRICVISPLNIDGKFLFYKLNRHPYYLSFDDGVKQTNLRKNDVLSCPLDIPSTKAEQTAIATILSDMDTEITALESRLEKTRTLKSGMMHELLTGRIRLI